MPGSTRELRETEDLSAMSTVLPAPGMCGRLSVYKNGEAMTQLSASVATQVVVLSCWNDDVWPNDDVRQVIAKNG